MEILQVFTRHTAELKEVKATTAGKNIVLKWGNKEALNKTERMLKLLLPQSNIQPRLSNR